MTGPLTSPLVLLGGAGVVCEGDSCEMPSRDQQLVNEMLDTGTV